MGFREEVGVSPLTVPRLILAVVFRDHCVGPGLEEPCFMEVGYCYVDHRQYLLFDRDAWTGRVEPEGAPPGWSRRD